MTHCSKALLKDLLLQTLANYTPLPEARFCRIALPVPPLTLKAWFKSQTILPKLFWSNKDDKEEVIALGAVLQLTQAAELAWLCESILPRYPELRLYGGRAFDQKAELWPAFSGTLFILPRIELRRNGQQYTLICNLSNAADEWQLSVEQTIQLLDELQDPTPLSPVSQTIVARRDKPNYTQWDKMVTEVTSPRFQTHTAKVVLSRETTIECDHNVDAMDLLTQWQKINPNCFQFILQLEQNNLFMGCSPERLYRRDGNHLVTEALAGTVERGATPEQDAALEQALLKDKKCQHENQLVLDDILSRLHQLSLTHHIDPQPTILKLNRIQHLKRYIQAHINPTLTDFDLLENLHPTPAVGGSPRASALRYIQIHEPYNRGWYAGAIGYISHNNSEFSVAIRSALLNGDTLKLYAGAGIVAGSDPEHEWFELDHKISSVLSILGQQQG